jgi:hypothetical protein
MSQRTSLIVQVPAQPDFSLTELAKDLGFETAVAGWFEENAPRWPQDHLVWLCFPHSLATFDCVHSLYGATVSAQGIFYKFLGVHGLYCLAAHLKQNPCPELKDFSGLVHAFGASKAGIKTVLNHEAHIGFDALDLITPVLYIENGVPRSIYTEWHSSEAEDPHIIAYSGSTDMFTLEEERERQRLLNAA